MIAFIEAHRERFGVEPICRVLQFAPSTYYAARRRDPSARALRDAALEVEIARVYGEQGKLYGARKLWHQLRREQIRAARCTVERLMSGLGLRGVMRRKRPPRTTIPAQSTPPADLVNRTFTALAPNLLWVADLTYVPVRSGFVYVAFVVDVFARRIVGWQVSSSLHAQLALDALAMALWSRRGDLDGLVHHSDRGVQYLSLRYTERLARAGIAGSVGSRGDSYDNALAETINGLYKTELVYHRGPWQGLRDVELATLTWVHWYNHERLFGPLGYVPPAEYEELYSRQHQQTPTPVGTH
jgi:putative transposase